MKICVFHMKSAIYRCSTTSVKKNITYQLKNFHKYDNSFDLFFMNDLNYSNGIILFYF